MLGLSACRKLLGEEIQLSDEELEIIREQAYAFAKLACDFFDESRKRARELASNHAKEILSLNEEDRIEFEEYASRLEYSAGLPRSEAEYEAWKYHLRKQGLEE